MTRCVHDSPRVVVTCALLVLASAPVLGQYSSSNTSNLPVADLGSEQVQPKVRATSDGGCYVAWFDNAGGGYDVKLQRLNARGYEQWAHNGVLIADRSVSSTVDYDLIVDSAGNAVIAFNDDRATPGGNQQVTVQKVSPAGTLLWGAGSTITNDANFKGNPRVCQLSTGDYVVGYSTLNTQIPIQRLDSNGVPQLGAPVVLQEAGHYMSLTDLQPDSAGNFIALWVRGSTTNPNTSSKALYTQKYDASVAPLWNAGTSVIVFNTTSIQNGYFPTMIPDGAGGAVYGWYETGGSRNAYIQHVLSTGALKFASPVANTGVTAGRIRISAGLAYDPVGGNYFLASTESATPTQGNYSVIVNKIDSAGARQWTDTGVLILPTGTGNQSGFVQCVATPDGGCMVFGQDSRSALTGVVFGAGVKPGGAVDWSILPCAVDSGKARLNVAMSTAGYALLAWTNGPSGSGDVLVQNVNTDGTLGVAPFVVSSTAGGTRCPGSSITLSVAAEGSPTIGYQWRKNTVDIGGANGTSYNIPSASGADAGNYDCRLTNDRGTVYSPGATIAVLVQDINGDGYVGTPDLLVLLGNFGGSVPPGTGGDLNGDGQVNTLDLISLIGVFGATCS